MIHIADFCIVHTAISTGANVDFNTDFIDRDTVDTDHNIDTNLVLHLDNDVDDNNANLVDCDTFRCNSCDNWFISPVPLGIAVSSLPPRSSRLLPGVFNSSSYEKHIRARVPIIQFQLQSILSNYKVSFAITIITK